MTIVIPDPEDLERPVPTSMQAASLLKAIHEQLHVQFDITNIFHSEDQDASADLLDRLTDILDKLEDIRELLVPTP